MKTIDATTTEDLAVWTEPKSPSPLPAVIATVVALLPMFLVVALYAGRDVVITGDGAIIDAGVRDVLRGEMPLLGAYSRVGWYHPGPAMFYALAPFSFIGGQTAWATIVGFAVIQGLALIAAARLAWRLGKLPLVLMVLAVHTLVCVGLRQFGPWDYPWNPSLALPFFLLLLLQVWAIGRGEYKQLPWALVVASFVVQTHLGFGPLVAVCLGWSLWWFFHGPKDRSWGRAEKFAFGLLVLMWFPPVVESLSGGTSGNFAKLFRYFLLKDELTLPPGVIPIDSMVGIPDGTSLLASQFRILPEWLGGSITPGMLATTKHSWLWLLIPIGLLVAAWQRSTNRNQKRALLLISSLLFGAWLSLVTLRGGPGAFAIFWRVTIAATVVLASLAIIVQSSRLQYRRWYKTTAMFLLWVLLLVPLAQVLRSVQTRSKIDVREQLIRDLVDIDAAETSQPILALGGIGYTATVVSELDRQGVRIGVSPEMSAFWYGGRRAASGAKRVWFVADGLNLSRLASLPGARVIKLITPLSDEKEKELRKLQIEVADQLIQIKRYDLIGFVSFATIARLVVGLKGVDQAKAMQLAKLNAEQIYDHVRLGIVAFDRADAPINYPI